MQTVLQELVSFAIPWSSLGAADLALGEVDSNRVKVSKVALVNYVQQLVIAPSALVLGACESNGNQKRAMGALILFRRNCDLSSCSARSSSSRHGSGRVLVLS